MAVRVTVLFFASLKRSTGTGKLEAFLVEPNGSETSAEGSDVGVPLSRLISLIEAKFPDLDMKTNQVSIAVNKVYIKEDITLKDGDEVAFLPPISGG